MSAVQHLRNIVADMAAQFQENASRLKRELTSIEARKAEIEAELDTAIRSRQRLSSFPIKVGLDFACPECWMQRGLASAMRGVGSERRGEDHFRCSACGEITALPCGEA